jgi:hypothetical protein
MTVREDARTLLYTQMSRGYVRQSEVVKILVGAAMGKAREIEPIVATELNAIKKLPPSAMLADAAKHGADVEALRQAVVGVMYKQFGT